MAALGATNGLQQIKVKGYRIIVPEGSLVQKVIVKLQSN